MAEEVERIYIIPLRKTGYKSSKAAPTAIKRVKHYLTRHMKVEEGDIWIDDSLNNAIWSHGKFKMPNKIRVKAVKFDDGVVEAYLPELEFKKSRRELLKEEREKKEPILKKEEAEGEAPAEEGYKVTPTAEGDVKIKKKKAPKQKKEEKIAKGKKSKAAEKKEEKAEKPSKKKTQAKKTQKKESKPKASSKPKSSKEKAGSQEAKKSE